MAEGRVICRNCSGLWDEPRTAVFFYLSRDPTKNWFLESPRVLRQAFCVGCNNNATESWHEVWRDVSHEEYLVYEVLAS